MKMLLKMLKVPKLFDKEAGLTSNIAVNKLLSPFYFLGMLMYLYWGERIPLTGKSSFFLGSFFLSFFSTLFYIWCSYHYQPDLDVRINRPGMSTFPFGSSIMNSPMGFVISPFQIVLGKTWYWFWQPYAELCTHRGVSHWPIISVWYRALYIILTVSIVDSLFYVFGLNTPFVITVIKSWANSFFPWNNNFGTLTWFMICFPVFISDLAHIIIDAVDSKRKGLSFCPPQIARGRLFQIREFIKMLINQKKV